MHTQMNEPLTKSPYLLEGVSDAQLLSRLHALAKKDQSLTAELLAHLAEVDGRKLWADAAVSSLFGYCTERLGMSESMAYNRIQSCRAARRFPVIFGMVATGDLHVSAIKMLAKHLDEKNHLELLRSAVGKSKRELEQLLAERFPEPDARTVIRKLPVPRTERLEPALRLLVASTPAQPMISPHRSASSTLAQSARW